MGSIGRKDKTKGRFVLESEQDIRDACLQLINDVEHFNDFPCIALRGGIYRKLDPTEVFATQVGKVMLGYKLQEVAPLIVEIDQLPTMRRTMFIKVIGYNMLEIPEEQRNRIVCAVLDVFVGWQQAEIEYDFLDGGNTMTLSQDFKVAVMYERNPNLVTIAGGLG